MLSRGALFREVSAYYAALQRGAGGFDAGEFYSSLDELHGYCSGDAAALSVLRSRRLVR